MASNLYGNEELTCMICHEDFGTVDNIPKVFYDPYYCNIINHE